MYPPCFHIIKYVKLKLKQQSRNHDCNYIDRKNIIKVLLHGKFDFFRRPKSTRKKSGTTDDKNTNI